MSHLNLDLYNRVDRLRREEEQRKAEMWRLARLATQGRPSWLSQRSCWLLCQLGRGMVGLGRQLQRYGAYEQSTAGT